MTVQTFQELTGIEYLMAEIACKYDKAFEKASWDDRIAKFNSMNFTDPNLFKNASNPMGLRAAIIALEKTTQGEPTGYTISLDAASSGLQLLSLLIHCNQSWKLCGGDSNIRDAYTYIYEVMDIEGHIERKDLKQTIMTALYGSEAMPKAIFGDNVDYFYKTMENITPGAWSLNIGIQNLWDEIEGNTYDWYLPDGFYACIETTDKEIKKFTFLEEEYELIQKVNKRPKFHKGLGPNLIHSIDGMIVREMYRRCMFNPKTTTRVMSLIMSGEKGTNGKSAEKVKELWKHYLQSGFLSTRILDYLHHDTIGLVDPLEIAKLISTFPDKEFNLISVHDCFRCHPNYGNDLRKQYNHILAQIAQSNLIDYIASQVAKTKVEVPKSSKIDIQSVLNSNYSLS